MSNPVQELPAHGAKYQSDDPDVIVLNYPLKTQDALAHTQKVRAAGLADADRRHNERMARREELNEAKARLAFFLEKYQRVGSVPPEDERAALEARIEKANKAICTLDRERGIKFSTISRSTTF